MKSLNKLVVIVALAMTAASNLSLLHNGQFLPELNYIFIDSNAHKPKLRILHVVTSSVLAKDGADRFHGTLVPTIRGTANSIVNSGRYEIDIQLILGYFLPPHLRREIEEVLREIDPMMRLFIWDDATPYETKTNAMNETIRGRAYGTALAKQHRYIVKEHINSNGTLYIVYSNATGSWENGINDNSRALSRPYDMYSCWEDDMLIQSHHFDHYLGLTEKLEDMASVAKSTPSLRSNTETPLSRSQLLQMVPGFIRAEVIMDANETHLYENATTGKHYYTVDCCNVTNQRIAIWETNPNGIRVRPPSKSVGTLGLLPVSGQRYNGRIGSIDVGDPKDIMKAELFAQQAGWMATKEQIRRFEKYCHRHGFLPPYNVDELVQTVEYWSGGFNLFSTRSGCAMQRVVPLDDAESWSNALVWHASNNKHTYGHIKQRAWDARLMREEILERYREGKVEGKTHLI